MHVESLGKPRDVNKRSWCLACLVKLISKDTHLVFSVNWMNWVHDEQTFWLCTQQCHHDSLQPGHTPSLISLLVRSLQKALFLFNAQQRLIRLGAAWPQSDLSLCWGQSQSIGFVLLRLNCDVIPLSRDYILKYECFSFHFVMYCIYSFRLQPLFEVMAVK